MFLYGVFITPKSRFNSRLPSLVYAYTHLIWSTASGAIINEFGSMHLVQNIESQSGITLIKDRNSKQVDKKQTVNKKQKTENKYSNSESNSLPQTKGKEKQCFNRGEYIHISSKTPKKLSQSEPGILSWLRKLLGKWPRWLWYPLWYPWYPGD